MKKYVFLFALTSLFQVRAEVADAGKVREYLWSLGYNQALKTAYGPNNYQVETLYEISRGEVLSNLEKLSNSSPLQALAIRFFHLGEVITAKEKETLFPGKNGTAQAAYAWLEAKDQILAACDEKDPKPCTKIKTTHSLYSVTLANQEILYAFVDYPADYRGSKNGPTAQLSVTSMLTLWKLQNSAPPAAQLTGVAADFGSGVGLLGHALLKLHPGLQKVYGLEIDEHSMRLSVLNADLNGLMGRYAVLNNRDTELLTRALAGKKLTFAVSNPPFNIVPPSLSEAFTKFGDGGCDGLGVTKIFIEQFFKNAAPNAKMIFYSQLAFNEKDQSHLEDLPSLKNSQLSVRLQFTGLWGLTFTDMNIYAGALIEFVKTHHPEADIPNSRDVMKELLACGVDSVSPYYVDIVNGTPTNTATPLVKNGALVYQETAAPFRANYGRPVLPAQQGGVYLKLEQARGGENIRTEEYVKELYERRKKLLEQQKKQEP